MSQLSKLLKEAIVDTLVWDQCTLSPSPGMDTSGKYSINIQSTIDVRGFKTFESGGKYSEISY